MIDVKVGDKFKGKINGEIFEVTNINEKDGVITYICNGKEYFYGLNAFKNCLLDKVKEET